MADSRFGVRRSTEWKAEGEKTEENVGQRDDLALDVEPSSRGGRLVNQLGMKGREGEERRTIEPETLNRGMNDGGGRERGRCCR